jgi:glutamate synthase domain-containing protein 3
MQASAVDAGDAAAARLREIVERHMRATGSERARALCADWDGALRRFRRFAPATPTVPAVSEAVAIPASSAPRPQVSP